MGWFGKKKEQEQPEPQGPDFVGALRSVVGFVMLGERRDVLSVGELSAVAGNVVRSSGS